MGPHVFGSTSLVSERCILGPHPRAPAGLSHELPIARQVGGARTGDGVSAFDAVVILEESSPRPGVSHQLIQSMSTDPLRSSTIFTGADEPFVGTL